MMVGLRMCQTHFLEREVLVIPLILCLRNCGSLDSLVAQARSRSRLDILNNTKESLIPIGYDEDFDDAQRLTAN